MTELDLSRHKDLPPSEIHNLLCTQAIFSCVWFPTDDSAKEAETDTLDSGRGLLLQDELGLRSCRRRVKIRISFLSKRIPSNIPPFPLFFTKVRLTLPHLCGLIALLTLFLLFLIFPMIVLSNSFLECLIPY